MAKKVSTKTRSDLSLPKYRGKHLVIVQDKIFTATTGQEAARIFREVIKKYPEDKPTITYVPKEDSLILAIFPRITKCLRQGLSLTRHWAFSPNLE